MNMLSRAFGLLAGAIIIVLGSYPVSAQTIVVDSCAGAGAIWAAGQAGRAIIIDTTGTQCVSAAVSASITGFEPGASYATLTATGSSADATLPTGAVVAAFNTGTTAVSCSLSVGAGTAVAGRNIIQPGSWFAFTVGSNTHAACINEAGDSASNVVRFSGGSGLPTGAGGGGSGAGGSVTQGTSPWLTAPAITNTASVASWSTGTALNTVVTVTGAGNYPANQLTLSASANVTAGAVTFQGTKADGTDETIPVAQILNPNTLAPLPANPYTLTTSKQDFLIVTQGYQTIKVKLTTAITTSSGAGTTVISNTSLPYNPVVSALLNPLSAGTAIIGKVGIDQTTPGTTNKVATASDVFAYETIAASQTAQAMGATGATGDYLSHCVVTPGTTSPGVVTILDNSTAIVSFPGGASSLSNLATFTIPIGAISVSGAWKITTGANVTVVCVGRFT